jgi:hypothetical protein
MSNKKPARLSAAKLNTKIENISIVGIPARMGPITLFMYADSFLNAAQALPSPVFPFEPARPYLVCHAVELGLKAFLSLRGVTMLELAEGSYGHNLMTILQKSDESGLDTLVPFTECHRAAIRLASTYYLGKVFEYPAIVEAMSGYPSMPPVDVLFDAAKVLVDSLRQPCREAN